MVCIGSRVRCGEDKVLIEIDDSINSPNIRRPLTGRLTIRVIAVKDVDHATTSRFARGPETFVIIKVEDIVRVRTKSTRNDKWLDENHEVDVDKANEIEMTVYDKPGDHPMPIGLLWIRISDIAEDLRRKKIEQEISGSGWVSAETMENSGPRPDGGAYAYNQGLPGPSAAGAGGAGLYANTQGRPQAPQQAGALTIDAWFALEPVGQVNLSLSFGNAPRKCGFFGVANFSQPNSTRTSVRSTLGLDEKAPFVRVRKRYTKCTGISSYNNNSTTLCAVRFAAISSSILRACNAQIANTPAIKSAIRRLSRSAYRNLTRSRTQRKKNSTIAFRTGSNP